MKCPDILILCIITIFFCILNGIKMSDCRMGKRTIEISLIMFIKK